MNIVVTGGCGYIGSVLTPLLLSFSTSNINVIDNCSRKGLSLLPFRDSINFYFSDLTKKIDEDVIKNADILIHLAAVVGFPQCASNPVYSQKLNVDVTAKLCDMVKPTCHFIFASTTSVYGNIIDANEESECKPESLYAQQKLAAEHFVRKLQYHTILRFSTAFGLSPNMRYDLLPHNLTIGAIKDGFIAMFEPYAIRSFIHVDDMANTIIYVLNNNIYGTYNVGNIKNEMTKLEIGKIIQSYTQSELFVGNFNKDPEKRLNSVSYKKAEENDFTISVSLDKGIKELVDYYPLYKNHD